MKNKDQIPNYVCGFLNLKKGMNQDSVMDFLSEEDFLPIVISGGFLPQYLRESHYIFRIGKEEMQSISNKNTIENLNKFRLFIINNVPEVCTTISSLESSIEVTEYDGPEDMKNIFTILVGIGKIYALYLRRMESECEVVDFYNSYIRESRERIEKISDFADGNEIPEMLSALIFEYVSDHKEVLIVDEKNINGRSYKALQEKEAIVYDETFYLFPPRLLMDICKPLLQTMSEPELKRRLKEEEILYCNSADYTVKKCLVNVFGVSERIRFLWIYKEMLFFPDNLRLEDIFDSVLETNEENEEEEI